jgi:hypothetical protein
MVHKLPISFFFVLNNISLNNYGNILAPNF